MADRVCGGLPRAPPRGAPPREGLALRRRPAEDTQGRTVWGEIQVNTMQKAREKPSFRRFGWATRTSNGFAPLAFEWAEGPAADPLQLAVTLEPGRLRLEMSSGGWSEWSRSWSLEEETLDVELSILLLQGQASSDLCWLCEARATCSCGMTWAAKALWRGWGRQR